MKICPNCGNSVDDTENKCGECGYIFTNEQDNENPEPVEVKQELEPVEKRITQKKKLKFGKREIIETVGIAVIVILVISLIITAGKMNKYKFNFERRKEYVTSLENQIDELTDENTDLNNQIDELQNGPERQLGKIRSAYEDKNWSEVIELANTLHEEHNGTPEDQEAQKLAKKSQDNINKAKQAAEEKKKQGYNTGITYEQLSRTPDKYKGEKVKFKGEVVQVIESGDDDTVSIRLAVNSDYDNIIYGEYSKDIVSSRVLEDDIITIYGTSVGTISYESTMSGVITIPGVSIEKIDQ